MEFSVLNIPVFTGSPDEAKQLIASFLSGNSLQTIATPNPEMLVEAWKYPAFRMMLSAFSLRICDGMGLVFASRGKLSRYPGVDCMLDTLSLCEKMQQKVFFLGSNSQNTLDRLMANVQHLYPQLIVSGAAMGGNIVVEKNKDTYSIIPNNSHIVVCDTIAETNSDILFVAFGHGKQEAWIHTFAHTIPTLKCAMGIGGAFEIIAGTRIRAPRMMRTFGLEWLWRLMHEPHRFFRICTAVLVFPALVCYESIKKLIFR